MASLTVRNINADVKERLRVRTAMHGHSMEEEARLILKQAVGGTTGSVLWQLSLRYFSTPDGVEIELASRRDDRVPLDFGDATE